MKLCSCVQNKALLQDKTEETFGSWKLLSGDLNGEIQDDVKRKRWWERPWVLLVSKASDELWWDGDTVVGPFHFDFEHFSVYIFFFSNVDESSNM